MLMARVPGWVWVAAAAVAAIPLGWDLGVLAAALIVGPEFGVFPVLTIPFGIAAALVLAFYSWAPPATRLVVIVAGFAVLTLLLELALPGETRR